MNEHACIFISMSVCLPGDMSDHEYLLSTKKCFIVSKVSCLLTVLKLNDSYTSKFRIL